MEIQMTNNIDMVKREIDQAKKKALQECGLTAEGYAKLACPVDTGNLRNSITYEVSDDEMQVGTNCEYGAYVELGTGIYATMGGGRHTPWCYQDSKGNWYMTYGNRDQPYLKPAVADHADTYQHLIESEFRNG